jgi:hypothetical protein
MSVVLYAIVGSGSGPVLGEGLENSVLRPVAIDDLTAVVSDLPRAPEATQEALWAYDRAVEQLMTGEAVLPARFGSSFSGDSEIRSVLASRHDELTSALERVRGAVELGVRATWRATADESRPTGPSAGTSYMQRRLELDRSAREIADKLDARLGELARASRSRVLGRPAFPVSASYLVEREWVDRFRVRVDELDAMIEEAELVCTGPWPPYSFMEDARR